MSSVFLYVLAKFFLKIKRTITTKTRCCYPSCKESEHLKTIPDSVRQQIAIQTKVFVPPQAVACPNHFPFDSWLNVSSMIQFDGAEFTKEYLEDMFYLLTNNSLKSYTSAESRKLWIMCVCLTRYSKEQLIFQYRVQ